MHYNIRWLFCYAVQDGCAAEIELQAGRKGLCGLTENI